MENPHESQSNYQKYKKYKYKYLDLIGGKSRSKSKSKNSYDMTNSEKKKFDTLRKNAGTYAPSITNG